MAIDPKEALAKIGIEDPDKIKDMEEFETILSKNYLHREQLDDPLSKEYKKYMPVIAGRIVGKTLTGLKSFLKGEGVELTPEEQKGDIDQVVLTGLTKLNEVKTGKIKELETASTTTKDEAVKQWEDKYQKAEIKRIEAEKLAAETGLKLQEKENNFQSELKSINAKNLLTKKFDSIQWVNGIKETEKKGIKATIYEELKFEPTEDGSDLDALNQKGERIPHKKVHGKFMSADEAIEDIVKREGGWANNPHIQNRGGLFSPPPKKDIQVPGQPPPEKKIGGRVPVSSRRG